MADLELYTRRRLTGEHLDRLSRIAAVDRERFYLGHPEYRSRLIAVAVCQGAASFCVSGEGGVKDLDVWSFFAAIPGERFPADIRQVHTDFGSSNLGRQPYDLDGARNLRDRRNFERWSRFEGRRVDLMLRGLDADPDEDPASALQRWLSARANLRVREQMPSNWWLAEKAVVLIDPARRRGEKLWPRPGGQP